MIFRHGAETVVIPHEPSLRGLWLAIGVTVLFVLLPAVNLSTDRPPNDADAVQIAFLAKLLRWAVFLAWGAVWLACALLFGSNVAEIFGDPFRANRAA